ncbi:response regulator [Kineococcus sp. R8]|nr:response regulator [Kineococcus siccus]
MVRVVLADDHAAVRAGLRSLLQARGDVVVVGEAADGASAVAQCRALRPDVVVMDLRMPGTDGIAATRAVVQDASAQVLVLTTFDVDDLVLGALRAGAAGYLLKTAGADELVAAVRTVAAGEGVVTPEVTRTLLTAFATTPEPRRPAPVDLSELTAREVDVLRCLAEGASNAEIAARLVISPLTAKTHVSRVLAKLGVASRVQAAFVARDAGLTAP